MKPNPFVLSWSRHVTDITEFAAHTHIVRFYDPSVTPLLNQQAKPNPFTLS